MLYELNQWRFSGVWRACFGQPVLEQVRLTVRTTKKVEEMTRKIVDARAGSTGDITHVRLEGNKRFTSLERAIPIVERGDVSNAHVVRRNNAKPHLRTNPDGRRANNLDDMAGSS